MVMEWVMQHWWLALIALGLVWSVAAIVIDNREHALRTGALPPLDLVPRAATVTSMRIAPQKMLRFFTRNRSGETGDLWQIEVQYADAGRRTRTEHVADLIHEGELARFPIGTTLQVYGFIHPQGRCLLTEAHDDVARRGYNLDGVRMRTDRQVWPPRTGSPLLGVMEFAESDEHTPTRRRSWPGDPSSAWETAGSASERLARPTAPPAVSAERVARWASLDLSDDDADKYLAPIVLVGLPLGAAALLLHWTLTDSPDGGMWILWVAVGVWLTIGTALLIRVRLSPPLPDDAERAVWIAEHGIPCEIYGSPFAHSNGEFSDTPGLILIDHRTTDAQSTRIVAAYRQWLRRNDTYQELQHGRLRTHGILASEEIFGLEAKGGYFAEGGFDHDGWALLAPSQGTHAEDEWWRSATLTPMLRDPAPPRQRSRR
ncbi:hypothetical protein GCM10027421_05830 [Microbacterium shaanxiense]